MFDDDQHLHKPRRVVYHGTWSRAYPHSTDQPEFHAGTYQAALDRLKSETMLEHYNPDTESFDGDGSNHGGATIHAYELREKPSHLIYDDPHFESWHESSVPKQYRERLPMLNKLRSKMVDPMIVTEHASQWGQGPIRRYTNLYEDPGSISYLIPKYAVRQRRVRYLGPQFLSREDVEDM